MMLAELNVTTPMTRGLILVMIIH